MFKITHPFLRKYNWFTLCGLFFLVVSQASAVSVQRHEIVGVVTVIDQANHTFVLQPDPPAATMTLHWDRLTEFFSDNSRVKADALPVRLRIRVRYVIPWFGNPEATRIFWHPAPMAGHASILPRLMTESSREILIASLHARQQGDNLLVWGEVEKGLAFSYPGPADSHLDLLVLDLDGRIISQTRINYLPRTLPVSPRNFNPHGNYAFALTPVPPPGATVKVVVAG